MSSISIFQQKSAPVAGREVSDLSKALAGANSNTSRRITMSKGVFRRIINGKEAGKIKDGHMNVIVINALPKVSRQFYATAFDPDAAPTLPDCWSNLGDVPDPKAANAQSANCASCSQNIDGNPSNNAIENLRAATQAENNRNRKEVPNKYGYPGLTLLQGKYWQPQLRVDGKSLYLGIYKNVEDAKTAYQNAVDKYCGEFRRRL